MPLVLLRVRSKNPVYNRLLSFNFVFEITSSPQFIFRTKERVNGRDLFRFRRTGGLLKRTTPFQVIPKPNTAQQSSGSVPASSPPQWRRLRRAAAARTREWMEALAAFLGRHRPLLEAHVVNFFKVLPVFPRGFPEARRRIGGLCSLR